MNVICYNDTFFDSKARLPQISWSHFDVSNIYLLPPTWTKSCLFLFCFIPMTIIAWRMWRLCLTDDITIPLDTHSYFSLSTIPYTRPRASRIFYLSTCSRLLPQFNCSFFFLIIRACFIFVGNNLLVFTEFKKLTTDFSRNLAITWNKWPNQPRKSKMKRTVSAKTTKRKRRAPKTRLHCRTRSHR